MAILFPASPSVSDTFTEGDIIYKWDGSKWIGLGVTPAQLDRLVEGSNTLEITSGNNLTYDQNGSVKLHVNATGLGVNTQTITGGRLIHAHNTGAGSAYFQSTNSSTGEGASTGALFGMSGTTCYAPWNYTDGDVVIATKAEEKLRITSDGEIGLSGQNYGTSGQVITSNGSGSAPTWQDAGAGGGGAMVLISTNTFTSSTTSVNFTGISGYTRYKIIFSAKTSGLGVLRMRVGINSTYDTGNNYNIGGGSNTYMQVLGGFSAAAKHGEINVMNLNQTETTAVFTSGLGESNDGTSHSYQTSGNGHRTATAQNCITLFGSSGNFVSGTFALYGVKYS
jgi:hypothetical protein